MSDPEPSAFTLTLAEASAEPISAQHPISLVAPAAASPLTVRLSHLFVPCADPSPIGTMITVKLRLSDAMQIEMRARVVAPPPDQAAAVLGMHLLLLGPSGDEVTERMVASLHEADTLPPVPASRSAQRVLVIDQNQAHRELAVRAMGDAGFEVLTARSGIEGLTLALKHQPAAIITDVTMPGMDGWQLLRVVRARPQLQRTPVIFLTELNSEAERLRGYQLGVDDYVSKPFATLELMARVERVIERSKDSAAERDNVGGMRGELAHVSLPSLLMLLEMERRNGLLHLSRGDEHARLYLRNGAAVRVDLDDAHFALEGAERLYYLLDWAHGIFDLELRDVSTPDVIGMSSTQLLIEHARLTDEDSR